MSTFAAHLLAFAGAALLLAITPGPATAVLLRQTIRHGRSRGIPNGPRTLDLDIVLYGGAILDEPGLCVPHPRAHERAFVLAPLLDVWPEAVIPGRGSAKALLAGAGSAGVQRL